MISALQSTPASADAAITEVRSISNGDLNWALAAGWRDFRDRRGDLLFVGLLYPLVCLVAILVTFNGPLLPLFFPLVAGLSIAGPAVASGFYELARRREEGLDATWRHFLDPLRDDRRDGLLALTGGLAVLFLAWLLVAYAIYLVTVGPYGAPGVLDYFRHVLTSRDGWALILLGNLAGFGFAVVALVTSVVSFPMAVDHPVDAGTAIRTSLAVTKRNPGAIASWGVRVAVLLALGTIPLGIGLAFVLPWLGYATWHLYTRAVVR